MSRAYDTLRRFLDHEMRMSHIYQPLMLKTLLKRNGRASTRQIAAAFLAEDQSQLDYYQAITNRMPGPVLRRRGMVVVKDDDGYALAESVVKLSKAERDDLVRRCDEAIEAYQVKRGRPIWEHRAVAQAVANAIELKHFLKEPVPDDLNPEMLKRYPEIATIAPATKKEAAVPVTRR